MIIVWYSLRRFHIPVIKVCQTTILVADDILLVFIHAGQYNTITKAILFVRPPTTIHTLPDYISFTNSTV